MNASELAQLYAKGDRNFQGFELGGVNLGWANLSESNLRQTNFCGANLSGACFKKSDLSGGTNLTFSDLSRADLSEADLRGANLEGANLEGANLSQTLYDEQTQFPKGFCPSSSGAILSIHNTLEVKESENKSTNHLWTQETTITEISKNENYNGLIQRLHKLEIENAELKEEIKQNLDLINRLNNQIYSIKNNGYLKDSVQALPQLKQDISKIIAEQYNANPSAIAISAQGISESEDSIYRRRLDCSIKQVTLQNCNNYSYWVIADSEGDYWLTPIAGLKLNPMNYDTFLALFQFKGEFLSGKLQLIKPAKIVRASTIQWELIDRGEVLFA